MSRTVSLSQSENMNMEQSIFWKSETAIERILLVSIITLILKPGFWPVFIAFYVLFEGILLVGRFISSSGLIIGAQVVITGVLLMFFHDIPVLWAEESENLLESCVSSFGIIALGAFLVYLVLHFISKVPAFVAFIVLVVDVISVIRFMYGYLDLKIVISFALMLTLIEGCRIIYLISVRNKKNTEIPGFSLSEIEDIRGDEDSPEPQLHKDENGKGNSSPEIYRYRWFAFFILLEALLFFIPTSDKPIDWSVLYRIGYQIRDGFETLAENTGYYFSGIGDGMLYQSGYSGLGNAPGSLASNSRDEIYVTTKGTTDSLYLTGKIMSGDDKDIVEDLEGRRLLNFLYALYSHDIEREEAKCFGRIEKATIELAYLRTKDIIRPENCLRIEYGNKDEKNDSGTEFKRMHKKGDSYNVIYMNIDYGSQYLEKIMRSPKEVPWPTYAEMEEYCGRLYDYQLSRSVSERDYNKWIQENNDLNKYLDAGDIATSRMKDLSEDITENAASTYDACRAIESYLRQYKYSTKLQGPEEGGVNNDNYVDSFLFETGKGYCVHFANSMVALLRLSGIPARCVEGYCYAFPDTDYDKFSITGDRAHVWVEAYIEGIGWVPFEPTAVRRTSIDTGWNIVLPEEEEITLTEEVSEKDSEMYIPQMPENLEENSDLEGDEEAGQKERHVIDVLVLMKTLGTILIGLLLYGIVMILAIILVRALRYQAAPLPGKLEKNMKDILFFMNREFAEQGKEIRMLEDYLPLIPEGENVPGERLEITDLKALSRHTFSVYYRQRFAGQAANGVEVRDAEYLRKYLLTRYLKHFMTSFGRKWK
ncbi:transglutaminase-like domain-containing protein [Butyrivibrio sp. WCE2006]|uniref:transglutaminase-like domain-containing protein n=1 Tax=Butyrivibrio sp. WCE2006 TaxID=1410611 RepID=UPI0009DCA7FD|nr:transglutaminase-like domain-containing protein [Butyrivibrio sp. WCE2006]